MGNSIDLHVHTTASDGTMSPSEVVKHGFHQGLKALAITDHDTVDGLHEGLEAGQKFGIEVVTGIEIGVEFPGEMHILGFFIDPECEALREGLQKLISYREIRNPSMLEKLRSLGMPITMEEVLEEAQGAVVGRPHIARVMVRKGYVHDNFAAFDKYLGAGKAAYVPKDRISPREGIDLIKQAGGIPVLAHPRYLNFEKGGTLPNIVRELKEYGLKGMEVYYTTNSIQETAYFESVATENNLLMTGGSDFHGENKPNVLLGRGLGNLKVPYCLLEKMKVCI